jgi:hypothetical protein
MTDTQFFLGYWRESLTDAERELEREQFTASRAIIRQSIANYRKWIADAEAQILLTEGKTQ